MVIILFNYHLSKFFDFIYRIQCYRYVRYFCFGMDYCPVILYYYFYRKTGVKLVIIQQFKKKKKKKKKKIVLNLYFEKLYIMIVTDMCAFVHAWVIATEWQFLCETMSKISHLFNKFQFIDQIAIKNAWQLLHISLHVQQGHFHKTLLLTWVIALDYQFWLKKNAKICILSSKKLSNMTQRLKGSKSVHASDESCYII